MGPTTALVVYLVIWWLVLFLVLPWGVKPIDRDDVEKGQAFGAPRKPMLLKKFTATTVISGGIFGVVFWLTETGLVDFRAVVN